MWVLTGEEGGGGGGGGGGGKLEYVERGFFQPYLMSIVRNLTKSQ